MTESVESVLAQKLETMFPDHATRAEIIGILNRYGLEPYEKEISRVRLDILKLAGASIEAVRMWVEVAKKDYREILASAEYPSQLRAATWEMSKMRTTEFWRVTANSIRNG